MIPESIKNINLQVFSCEEAALEGQMLSVSVCQEELKTIQESWELFRNRSE